MKALDLGLCGVAAQVASVYESLFPSADFTSGRRSLYGQAHAMATNVAIERLWIRGGTGVKATYVQSEVADACHAAVLSHPEAVTVDEICSVLLRVLSGYSNAELALMSLHLGGEAFDVNPATVTPESEAWLDSAARLYGGKYLPYEGGLRRCHWQGPTG